MNNLYNIYLEKKSEDKNKIILFKNGNFYIVLGEDAQMMNKEFGLKLTKFSNQTDKCGFPDSEIKKYTKFISLLGFEYEFILGKKDQVIEDIKALEFDKLDGITAIKKLKEYNEILSEI
ncbi:MAG: hypothetical protein PHX04_02370 [Bacilli bacterium]|nr:hypothetical protein [Bacilli bacterium]